MQQALLDASAQGVDALGLRHCARAVRERGLQRGDVFFHHGQQQRGEVLEHAALLRGKAVGRVRAIHRQYIAHIVLAAREVQLCGELLAAQSRHRIGVHRADLTAAKAFAADLQLGDMGGVHCQLGEDQVMQHAWEMAAAGAGDDLAYLWEQV